MKAVKIEAYMSTAHFRLPKMLQLRASYPLPPYSTVIGMIHHLCKWKEYHPMDVSVAGKGYPFFDKAVTIWEGGMFSTKINDDFKKRFSVHVPVSRGYVGMMKKPHAVEFIGDLTLRLHIAPNDPDELEEIYNALDYPCEYPCLGKRNDFLRIDRLSIVDIEDERKTVQLDMPAYVPRSELSDGVGTIFYLHKDYYVNNRGFRKFNDVQVFMMVGEMDDVRVDSDGDPVFLA